MPTPSDCEDCPTTECRVTSPAGVWTVRSCARGLHWLKLGPDQGPDIDPGVPVTVVEEEVGKVGSTAGVVNWLKLYFEDVSSCDSAKLPVVCDTVFSKGGFKEKAWREIYNNLHIGDTATYGEVARRCGSPGASRAVGTAMRRNPVSLVVPCHRVVRAGQGAGHYSAGTRDHLKVWLLQHEKSSSSDFF